MLLNAIQLSVLVKNRAIAEYTHEEQTYIEGRAGSNYEIEIRNNTLGRVEAVLSVDGLSIIDGKEAGPQSQGYLIESFNSVRIPGWLLDTNNIAKFAFAGRDGSYASQISDGKSRNIGVIGAMVFAQRIAQPTFTFPYTTSAVSPVGIMTPFIGMSSISNSMTAGASVYAPVSSSTSQATNASGPQTLGTAFGPASQFATQAVAFQRGLMIAIMSIYYDNLAGLRAKGVPITRIKRDKASQRQPDAFPNRYGCNPPSSWQR